MEMVEDGGTCLKPSRATHARVEHLAEVRVREVVLDEVALLGLPGAAMGVGGLAAADELVDSCPEHLLMHLIPFAVVDLSHNSGRLVDRDAGACGKAFGQRSKLP